MAGTDRCNKSPIGAHFWIEKLEKRVNGLGWFKCKHCGKGKWMAITFETAVPHKSDLE